jgi:hypothetical protein
LRCETKKKREKCPQDKKNIDQVRVCLKIKDWH